MTVRDKSWLKQRAAQIFAEVGPRYRIVPGIVRGFLEDLLDSVLFTGTGAPSAVEIDDYADLTAYPRGVLVRDAGRVWLTLRAVPATNIAAPTPGATWTVAADPPVAESAGAFNQGGDARDAGELGFIDADGAAIVAAGAWSRVASIKAARRYAMAGVDPSLPDTDDDAVDLKSILDRALAEWSELTVSFSVGNDATLLVSGGTAVNDIYDFSVVRVLQSSGQMGALGVPVGLKIAIHPRRRYRSSLGYFAALVAGLLASIPARLAAFAGNPDQLLAVSAGQVKGYDFGDARRHINGPDNHVPLGTFASAQNVPAAADQIYFAAENQGRRQINVTWGSSDEEADLGAYLVVGQRLHFTGGAMGTIVGSAPSKNSVAHGGYQFDVGFLSGNFPAAGQVAVTAEGRRKPARLVMLSNVQHAAGDYDGDGDPTVLELEDGLAVAWTPPAANAGAATLAVDGTGEQDIRHADGSALAAAELQANRMAGCLWDATAGHWKLFFGAVPDGDVTPIKLDAGTAAKRAAFQAALAPGRLLKDIAGNAAVELTAAEAAYDSIEFTGLKTADIVVTLPAAPSGLRMLRDMSTGNYAVKVKAAGQAANAAIVLAPGDNVVLHHGGSLANFPYPARKWVNADISGNDEAIAKNLDDDDWVTVTVEATENNDDLTRTAVWRWGDMESGERLLVGIQGQNEAVILTKDGSTLKARKGGGLTGNANALVYAERRQYAAMSLA